MARIPPFVNPNHVQRHGLADAGHEETPSAPKAIGCKEEEAEGGDHLDLLMGAHTVFMLAVCISLYPTLSKKDITVDGNAHGSGSSPRHKSR